MIVNKGYPKECNYLAHINDTFNVYLKLENLDGTKFDATGMLFDFVNMSGSQYPYRQSIYGIAAVETEEVVYIPVEYEKNRLEKAIVFKNSLHCHLDEDTQTWLTGRFEVSRHADRDALSPDVIEIDTDTLKVRITVLTTKPDGEIIEPGGGGLDYFILD